MVLMQGRAEKALGNILPGKNLDHARDGESRFFVDGADPCMRVWRAQHFQVHEVVHHHIHRVTGLARDNGRTERTSQTCSAGAAGDVLFRGFFAVKGVRDAAITGAPAQIALQRLGKIRQSLVIERRGGHDHPRRAKAALERLRFEERPLHGM